MTLTDREAADRYASQAVADAHSTLSRFLRESRGQEALGFRKGLIEASKALADRLVEVYAEVGASDPGQRDDVVAVISQRVVSFIKSSVASQRGSNAANAARTGTQLSASYNAGVIGNRFDLAVYEKLKAAGANVSAAPRPKQDKFGILDSPRLYEDDFKKSVGVLGVSVIFFDLDDFKSLNTRFTEPVIDRTVLPELQKLIASLVVGRGFAYAEGGDEFVITLPNTDISLAEAFASVLLDRIRAAEFSVDGEDVAVTASAGIAASADPEQHQAVREAASRAKGEAKSQGKDRYAVSPMVV